MQLPIIITTLVATGLIGMVVLRAGAIWHTRILDREWNSGWDDGFDAGFDAALLYRAKLDETQEGK